MPSHQEESSKVQYRFDLNSFSEIIDNSVEPIKCKKVSASAVSANAQAQEVQSSYYLINYDKKIVRKCYADAIDVNVKHFRSVILNEDRRVIGFSPPMCETRYVALDVENIQFAEEFVEGTMVNLFYNSANDVQGWVFSTKNTVCPVEKTVGKCFKKMFLEACADANLNFDDLPKDYCYSFVMQHPDNVIVSPVKNTALYIVATYFIENNHDFTSATAYEMKRSSVVHWSSISKVAHPARFTIKGEDDFNKIVKLYASSDSLYYYPGVMFRTTTGERFKFRNPNYEMVKNAKGVSARCEIIYLHLKQMNYLKKHFERCPEDELKFFEFQSKLFNYTSSLHKNYLDCYIYKKMGLKDFPKKYRNNMYKLHKQYLEVLKYNGKRVTMSHVIQFVNSLSVSSQFYFLNQQDEDESCHVHSPAPDDETLVLKTPECSPVEFKCPNAP